MNCSAWAMLFQEIRYSGRYSGALRIQSFKCHEQNFVVNVEFKGHYGLQDLEMAFFLHDTKSVSKLRTLTILSQVHH